MSTSPPRGRRILGRLRRGELDEREPEIGGARALPAAAEGPAPGTGWDQTAPPPDSSRREADGHRPHDTSLVASVLALLSDPRVDRLTVAHAAAALQRPADEIDVSLEALVQAGHLHRTGLGRSAEYRVDPATKQELEAAFRDAARELGVSALATRSEESLEPGVPEDAPDEPRLPVTAGLLSLFLPGTGQLLNGDVGRASLVFAVWSLAWITQLSPVWTFVCLYAGAEAFFSAKIRGMERRLAAASAHRPSLTGRPDDAHARPAALAPASLLGPAKPERV